VRRRELLAGVGSVGVFAGGTGVVLGGLPSFGNDEPASSTSDEEESDGPIEVETIDARGSEAGTVAVPNGRPTVVMFFVTGCGTCQAQTPQLGEARSRLEGTDATVMSVTYQSKDNMPPDRLRDWWREHDGDWSVGYDPDTSLAANYGVVGFPVTIAVDGRGEKRWERNGRVPPEDIVAAVEPLLSGDAAATEPSSNA
jgi:cytochrome oxidase Cu insertion factor (SCO1/SenC/PrrC family)